MLILSLAISGLLAACNNNDANDDTVMDDTAGAMADGTTAATDGTPAYDDTGAMGTDGAMGVQTGPITDTEFYQQAMDGNRKEIAAATMGQAQAQDASVKDYAQMLVTDHTAMGQKLAEAAGMAVAATPAPDATATADLQGQSGADFDRAFIDKMVMDHQKTIAMFENASQNASTDAAKSLAQDALPKLREHLQRAQELQQQLGGAAGAMDDTTNP
jgi:putative membrane protein